MSLIDIGLACLGVFVLFTWGKYKGSKSTSGSGYTTQSEDEQVSNYLGHVVNIDKETIESYDRTETSDGTNIDIVTKDSDGNLTGFNLFRRSKS